MSYLLTSKWKNRDSALCRNWHPPAEVELIAVIKKFKVTSAETDYEAHSDYSCSIEGKINIDDTIYEYELNAGGYLTLNNATTKEVRLCAGNEPALKKYFLSVEPDDTNLR